MGVNIPDNTLCPQRPLLPWKCRYRSIKTRLVIILCRMLAFLLPHRPYLGIVCYCLREMIGLNETKVSSMCARRTLPIMCRTL